MDWLLIPYPKLLISTHSLVITPWLCVDLIIGVVDLPLGVVDSGGFIVETLLEIVDFNSLSADYSVVFVDLFPGVVDLPLRFVVSSGFTLLISLPKLLIPR